MLIGIYTPYLETMSGGERYILTIASLLSEIHDVSLLWNKEDEAKYKKLALMKLDINIDKVKFDEDIFALPKPEMLRESKKYDQIIYLSDGSIPSVASKLYVHFQFPVEWVKANIITKIKARRIRKIFTNSQFTKKYIDRKFGVNSMVLYPPVTLLKAQKEKENKIISVGRLNKLEDGTYFKRQDILINTFKDLVDNGLKDWKLVMVISTNKVDHEADLDELTKASKGYSIEILHNITNENLINEYESAKLYWHAAGYDQDLATHPEWAEHFGITTVEAMSAGVVPLVFNAGGQTEIIKNGVSGYLWNSLKELKDNTLLLISSEVKRNEVATKAIRESKEFSVGKFKEKLMNMITQ